MEAPRSKRPKLPLLSSSSIGHDHDTDTTIKYPPYYHENFKIILNNVLSGSDSGLLAQQELDFVQRLLLLSGIVMLTVIIYTVKP